MTDDDAQARRRRREWILANHPDRGGDPQRFMEGMARFARADAAAAAPTGERFTVYRSRGPIRRVKRLVRDVRRLRSGKPPSPRVR